MTPDILFEILKGVPKEAWPEGIRRHPWDDKCLQWTDWNHQNDIPMHIAINAFIGSMMMYMITEGSPSSFTITHYSGGKVRINEYHDGTGYEIDENVETSSLFESLALTCKRIANI